MIIETEVKMVINQYNIEYYRLLGYEVHKIGERILVQVEDLPPTSGVKIHTRCDFCGQIFVKSYRRYMETKGKVCCQNCRKLKVLENTINKYGVRSTLMIPEVHDKIKQNNLQKFGVEYPLESAAIRQRAINTMFKRYGVFYTLQSFTLRTKVGKTMYVLGEHSRTYTSSQQKHIAMLCNGKLNFPVGPYHVDIFLAAENLCIEYDGSGHNLSVRMGKITQDEFDKKEQARDLFLNQHGYKILHIKSFDDKLPNDEIILQKILDAKNLMSRQNLLNYTISFTS